VEYFKIGKQKVVLFPIFRENGWVTAGYALRYYTVSLLHDVVSASTVPAFYFLICK
jgi:hypothetical protein